MNPQTGSEAGFVPLRVLEIETYGQGGLAHYVFNLSRALAERGHRVDLLTTARYELTDLPRPTGMHLHQPLGLLSERMRQRRSQREGHTASKLLVASLSGSSAGYYNPFRDAP